MNTRQSLKLALAAAWFFGLLALIAGCGGGGGGGGGGTNTTGSVTVELSTSQTTIAYGQSITITAVVSNSSDQTVVFTISPSTTGLTQVNNHSAKFTAPSASGTFTITATPDVGGTPGKIIIKVVPIAISINPKSAQLPLGGTTDFTAYVTGSSNVAATFKASAGTVTALTSNSVKYTAPSVAGTYTLTATASASGSATATATITVGSSNTGGTATVQGTVKSDQGAGIGGVVVQFYNSGGTQVGQATTASNGTFSAKIPATAVSFGLSSASINTNTYFESFTYNNLRYDPLITGCYASMGSLSNGQVLQLPSTIVIASQVNPPPPPPDGCS